MALNEIKECCKGHGDLATKVAGQGAAYIAKRHAKRLMPDDYGKGIVRGQAENVNLRVTARYDAVTHAETLCTPETEAFYGGRTRPHRRAPERPEGHEERGNLCGH